MSLGRPETVGLADGDVDDELEFAVDVGQRVLLDRSHLVDPGVGQLAEVDRKTGLLLGVVEREAGFAVGHVDDDRLVADALDGLEAGTPDLQRTVGLALGESDLSIVVVHSQFS